MSIPLPGFEDRLYLNALMGIGADHDDPIKGNADSKGPVTGTLRVVRFGASDEYRMTITRSGRPPDSTHADMQFRCVLDAASPWK